MNAYNNPEYEPDSAVITHVDEFLKLMRVLTDDNRYEAISFTEQEKKEEDIENFTSSMELCKSCSEK